MTKAYGYVTMAAVTIELDTHPEGWRDRPDEAPATSLMFKVLDCALDADLERGALNSRPGANSGRVHGSA